MMRCWHKSLIPYLPRQQLLGQWRECCLIAKNIAENGTPNHILVNKIMDYPPNHFYQYTKSVLGEINNRGYKYKVESYNNFIGNMNHVASNYFEYVSFEELFSNWHNARYLKQCMYNLEEKHDCQGITDDEWYRLVKGYREITGKDWK